MLRTLAEYIQSALDIVLPRKERTLRTLSYSLNDLTVAPVQHEAHSRPIITLMHYREKAVEDIVQALKYDRTFPAASLLAEVLVEYLREEIANLRLFSTLPVVLVPIPLHEARLRERGFNQVAEVLRALPPEFKDGTLSSIEETLLVRSRDTKHQTRLSRAERLSNVHGAFALAHPAPSAHIILIDDVTTTGATLCAAAAPLKGVQVTLLALAHA